MEAFLYWKLISKNPHDPWAGAWGLPPGREFSCWAELEPSGRAGEHQKGHLAQPSRL